MPNAENCSLAELETAAKVAPSKRSHNRLMAMRALLIGILHGQVADLYNVTRRTVSYWIKQFNDHGIDALIEHARSGRPRKILQEKKEYYFD